MKLAQCTTVIFAALCLLCLLSIEIGSRQTSEDPFAALGISRCTDSLCVAGIQPGTTPWTDSKNQLSSLPGATLDGDGGITLLQHGIKLVFWKSLDSEKTHVIIEREEGSQLFALQDLVYSFGQPCSLDITDEEVYVEYPQFIAKSAPFERKAPHRMNMSMPVSTLYLPGQELACNKPLVALAGKNLSARWCGFSSLNHYINECQK